MYPIPENPIYVIDGEGLQQLFDPEKLQQSLQSSFIAAGNPDGYLAEDIALSVEAAMLDGARLGRFFTQSEVDAAVIRILETAGFAEVARIFQRANSRLYIAVDARLDGVRQLIERHLGLGGAAAETVALRVFQALNQLGIASGAPGLYLELARHYERQCAESITPPMPAAAPDTAGRFLLSAAEVGSFLTGEGRLLQQAGILQLTGISRLYPNFRMGLHLGRLAEYARLRPPVTEMLMADVLYRAGESVGQSLRAVCRHLGGNELPLYLKLPEFERFVRDWLEADYPAGRPAAMELLNCFRAALGYPVRKVSARG
ncbi:hypothetical protein SDC9_78029 [bioreactor metagenome]|uniref:ATP-cone domain-containing protein n=1 Tax=bioreactor metagenome TaxID=1076179 RepID=A0A644YZU9_9ZZZZ